MHPAVSLLALGALAYLAARPAAAAAAVVVAPPRPRRMTWSPPGSAAPYREAIAAAELAYGLPDNLLLRQLDIESNHFAPDVVAGLRASSAGAIGIAQFEPATAAELGVDPFDPESSIEGAARYMAELYARFGTWALALAAYNWGQGNLKRKGIEAAPAETRKYVATILAALPEGIA